MKHWFCPIPTDEAETWRNCPDKYGTKVAERRNMAEDVAATTEQSGECDGSDVRRGRGAGSAG